MNALCDLYTGNCTKILVNAQKTHRNICCFSTNVIQILTYIHLNVFDVFIMLLHPYTDCWTCIYKPQCISVRVFMRLPATAWRFCWLVHCIFIFHCDVSRCATDTLQKPAWDAVRKKNLFIIAHHAVTLRWKPRYTHSQPFSQSKRSPS